MVERKNGSPNCGTFKKQIGGSRDVSLEVYSLFMGSLSHKRSDVKSLKADLKEGRSR